jgi:toxin ParE1/3/4
MNAEDRWAVTYSNSFERDLDEIFDYIADATLDPEIAARQVARIKETANTLDFMPYRHRLHYDERLRGLGVRRMLVDNYVIWYVPDEKQKTVTITRVIHSARDINKVLDKPEQTEK